MKKTVALLISAALLMTLFACGTGDAAEASGSVSDGSVSGSAGESIPEETAETVPQELAPEASEMQEEVITGAELEIREREQFSTTELRDQYSRWAEEIIMESLQKLADRGAVEPLRDEEPVSWKIPFTDDGDDCQVAFLDPAAQAELTQPFDQTLDGIILDADNYVVFCYGNQEGDVPWFTPVGYNGLDDICTQYAGRFSETMQDCRYIVWVCGCLSRADEDFYNGSIDRRVITTVMLIADPVQREILHIENLGTDTPGSSVKLPGGNIGETNWDGAWAYLSDLLAQS